MAHIYASVAVFNDWLRDDGSTTFATESALILNRKLAVLDGVSRTIDSFCNRSKFGSGFGPRIGTNRYDGDGTRYLYLKDDLLSLTSLTTRPAIGGTETTHTEETDFIIEPYDTSPQRRLYGQGSTTSFVFPHGHRTADVAGTWGYADLHDTVTATASAISTTTTTGVTVSDGDEFSPGQTLRIDDEQMYVRAVSGTTLTVDRGANGTTAATHSDSVAIDIYRYPPAIVACQQDLSLLRWKRRNAGSDGTDGGGDIPAVRPQADERSILFSHLRDLRLILEP